MIARLDKDFLLNRPSEWVASLVAAIVRNSHMIDCDYETLVKIDECVAQHCSTVEKELIRNGTLYDITALKRKHLSTVNVDGSLTDRQYLNLFGEPSLVLLEHGPNEWEVYKGMMDVYKRDKEYGTIYQMLRKAASDEVHSLRYLHAGGNGHFINLVTSKDSEPEYQGLTHFKIYAVTDSDRDSESAPYGPTPKAIYRFFCGVDDRNAEIDRKHIDTPIQPLYHWHMWKKRAIENYFPPDAYEQAGINADGLRSMSAQEQAFVKIGSPHVIGYTKDMLASVSRKMGRKEYEDICETVRIDGRELSEIRLFLLKMAKVI